MIHDLFVSALQWNETDFTAHQKYLCKYFNLGKQ